jgi:hypothetical protein
MRRLRRHLFTLCSGASLLVGIAAVVLWARSYSVADAVWWTNWTEQTLTPEALAWARQSRGPAVEVNFVSRGDTVGVFTFRGKLLLSRLVQATPTDAWQASFRATYMNRPQFGYECRPPDRHATISALDMSGFWGRLGFGNFDQPIPGLWSGWYRWVFVPLWLVALVSTILPAAWARRHLRAGRRARQGLCPSCGYDLRASPERCPECGTSTATAAV